MQDKQTLTLTIELAPDDLKALVAQAVQREVAKQMPNFIDVRRSIRAEVSHITRTVVSEISREVLPGIVAEWLRAREGWVGKLLMRTVGAAARSAEPTEPTP